jgi:hypothetical protein
MFRAGVISDGNVKRGGIEAKTHPDEAPPVCPSLRLRRIEGRKKRKLGFTLFAALAGERVGQRSVAGVSCSRRSNEYVCKLQHVMTRYEVSVNFCHT